MSIGELICANCHYVASAHAGPTGLKCLYVLGYFIAAQCGEEIDHYPTEYCDGLLSVMDIRDEYHGYATRCLKCRHRDLFERRI